MIEGCFDFDASYSSARHSVWCQARGEIVGNQSIIDIPLPSNESLVKYCFVFGFIYSSLNQAKTKKKYRSNGVTPILEKKVTSRVE